MVISALRRKFSAVNEVIGKYHQTNPALENVYRELFVRDLQRIGVADAFYPVGDAANHSLMYLLLRCLQEFPIKSVLELGSGQSSILIDRFKTASGRSFVATSIEHDSHWAKFVQSAVGHDVRLLPLIDRTVDGRDIQFYADGFCDRAAKYDLVLIDGPPAFGKDAHYNRLGALALVDNLAESFVVIVDDAHRRGERLLVERLRENLASRRIDFRHATIAGMKQQHLICGGEYSGAAFF